MASTSIIEPGVALQDGDATSADALRARDERLRRRDRTLRIVVPIAVIALLFIVWEALVRINNVPHYIIPAPSLILSTLFENWGTLSSALWFTVKLTLLALLAAIVGGVLLAIAFALFKWVEIGPDTRVGDQPGAGGAGQCREPGLDRCA